MEFLANREGLSHVLDSVGDYYIDITPTTGLNEINKDKNHLHDSGFVSPVNVTMPFAKLIPILSSLVREIFNREKYFAVTNVFSRLA